MKSSFSDVSLDKKQAQLSISALNSGTWIWNIETGETFFNERWAEIIGYTLKEISPTSIRTWEQFAHPDDLSDSSAALEKHFNGLCEYYECECRMRHKNGHWVWVLDRGQVVSRTADGKPLLAAGCHLDITERKKAEEKILLNKSMLERTEKLAHIGSWEWEVSKDQVIWSDEIFRIMKLPVSETAPSFAEHPKLYHPEDMEKLNSAVKKAVLDGTPYELELTATLHDGTEKICLARGEAVVENGKTVRLFGSLQDITDKVLSERALKSANRMLQGLFDAVPDLLVAVDRNYKIIVTNSKGHDQINQTDVKKTDTCYGRFKLLDSPCEPCSVKEVFKTGNIFETESVNPVDKRIREIRAFPIFDASGNVEAVLEHVRDITDRKRMAEEKINLQMQLLQSQKMELLGRLAGGIAHDFNNILGVIIGHTELALDKIRADHPLSENLLEINSAAERSSELTKQLLTFARKQTIVPKVTDINLVIQSMLKLIRRLIGEDIDLIWNPEYALKNVLIDNSQLDQILVNLCVNARDSIELSGRIMISTENILFEKSVSHHSADIPAGEYVLLKIEDSGSGMSEETASHIFEPFFSTKGGKGTGLGLATVHSAVLMNNGFITVKSSVEQGCCFCIYFPVCNLQKTVDLCEHEPAAEKPVSSILLVEDDPEILNLTTCMLKKLGHNVFSANSPESALSLLRDNKSEIQLLITDVIMPGMNGVQLLENIKLIKPDISCIFMSGYPETVLCRQGMDTSEHFLQKPFTMRQLEKKIAEILSNSSQHCF